MSRSEEIRQRLMAAFAPAELHVEDDSEAHRGHAGYQEGGESHFRVRLRAEAFAGQSRIARHRAVHAALLVRIDGELYLLDNRRSAVVRADSVRFGRILYTVNETATRLYVSGARV